MTVGWGGALIVAACICWGIDNNLTRKLSAADPVQIAMVKGVAAGVINTALGFAHGAQLARLTRNKRQSRDGPVRFALSFSLRFLTSNAVAPHLVPACQVRPLSLTGGIRSPLCPAPRTAGRGCSPVCGDPR